MNFVFVDFVSSITTWYNGMSNDENAKIVYVRGEGAQQFLTRLEHAAREMLSGEDIKKVTEQEVYLTVITNGTAQPNSANPKMHLRFFGVPVVLTVINFTEVKRVSSCRRAPLNRTT